MVVRDKERVFPKVGGWASHCVVLIWSLILAIQFFFGTFLDQSEA